MQYSDNLFKRMLVEWISKSSSSNNNRKIFHKGISTTNALNLSSFFPVVYYWGQGEEGGLDNINHSTPGANPDLSLEVLYHHHITHGSAGASGAWHSVLGWLLGLRTHMSMWSTILYPGWLWPVLLCKAVLTPKLLGSVGRVTREGVTGWPCHTRGLYSRCRKLTCWPRWSLFSSVGQQQGCVCESRVLILTMTQGPLIFPQGHFFFPDL